MIYLKKLYSFIGKFWSVIFCNDLVNFYFLYFLIVFLSIVVALNKVFILVSFLVFCFFVSCIVVFFVFFMFIFLDLLIRLVLWNAMLGILFWSSCFSVFWLYVGLAIFVFKIFLNEVCNSDMV